MQTPQISARALVRDAQTKEMVRDGQMLKQAPQPVQRLASISGTEIFLA